MRPEWLLQAALRGVAIAACLHTLTSEVKAQSPIFDQTVIGKWKAYESFSHSLQIKSRWTVTPEGGKPAIFTRTFRQNRGCVLISSVGDEETPSKELYTFSNPHYAAVVERKQHAAPPTLRRYTPGTHAKLVGEHTAHDTFAYFSMPHLSYDFAWLSDIVASPGFKVGSVSREKVAGQEMVRVEYEYDRPDPRFQTHRQGAMYFDPESWCIRRVNETEKQHSAGKEWQTMKREYENDVALHISGFPLLRRYVSKTTRDFHQLNRKHNSEIVVDFDYEINDGVPDSEFTLAAFGLPEPGGGSTARRRQIHLWLIAAGASCAIFVILLRGRRWRTERSSEAS